MTLLCSRQLLILRSFVHRVSQGQWDHQELLVCMESRAHKVIQVDQVTQGHRVSQGHKALMAPR